MDEPSIPADTSSVARVRPRTSKGITELLSLHLVLLSGTGLSKKCVRNRPENGDSRLYRPRRARTQTTRNAKRTYIGALVSRAQSHTLSEST